MEEEGKFVLGELWNEGWLYLDENDEGGNNVGKDLKSDEGGKEKKDNRKRELYRMVWGESERKGWIMGKERKEYRMVKEFKKGKEKRFKRRCKDKVVWGWSKKSII